ncbi:MAG: leucyl aminopeptidase family protein [Angustibacter sp.]
MRSLQIRAVPGSAMAAVTGLAGVVDVLALPVRPVAGRPVLAAADRRLAERLGIALDSVIDLEHIDGSQAQVVRVPWSSPSGRPSTSDAHGHADPGDDVAQAVQRVLLFGLGDGHPAAFRSAGAALARACRGRDRLVVGVGVIPAAAAGAFAEGLVLGSYVPARVGIGGTGREGAASRSTGTSPVRRVDVVGRLGQPDLDRGARLAQATVVARDLAQTPASTKTPAWLAGRARRFGTRAGLAVRVWDHRELARSGFGGLVAVGGGSVNPPRMVQLAYQPSSDRLPAGRSTARGRSGEPLHVVVIGKGITFDSGGLSLKPRDAMVAMKTDMTGAGVVLAVLLRCAQLGVRVRVTGLLALAENAIGAGSYRPGDVVVPYGGTTVEVRNTDAEGRLVLADALGYADSVLDPDVVVDVATLTGAATLGLGRGHAALFTDDDRLATGLDRAGVASGEPVWRMPLVEEYRPSLSSAVADLCHVSTDRNKAGAITAALFLREFTGGRRWAHLDIAGPARSDKDAGLRCRGGTGFGARLLLQWLLALR